MNKSKRLITIIILLLSVNNIFGQGFPAPINHLVKQLQKKGADTILVYISGCDGCEITNKPVNCICLDKDAISDVYLIFRIKGEFYKEDFSCCEESALTKIKAPASVSYFLSLRDTLKKRDEYYKQAAKRVEFLPPIATDNPYEAMELILPGHNYEISLSSYQTNEGYNVWKHYFWIDSEIKLMNLVRKDLAIQITKSN